MWINSLEVASQRCNEMQKSTALMTGKTSGSAKSYLAGAGITASVRTGHKERARLVQVYHTNLSKLQEEWLECITSSTSGCLVGWLDDTPVLQRTGQCQKAQNAACRTT